MNKFNKNEWQQIDSFAKKYKAIKKLGGVCEKCGEDNFFKLEFHHIDDNDKEYNFADIKYLKWSTIEKEINKCMLLCRNCHMELHYSESNHKNIKIVNKKTFLLFKNIFECQECGYNECNSALDFHHIDKNEKKFKISEISKIYYNVQDLADEIEEELNKCVVICKNCHSLEHSGVEFFEKHKDEIIKKSENLRVIHEKFDKDKVKEMYESGMRQVDIAKYFNVRRGSIFGVIKRIRNEK